MYQPSKRQKIKKLIDSIDDLNIRMIISDVIDLENHYRDLDEIPLKKIETIVDNEAKFIEENKE